jgi:gluconolactonase
VAPGAELVEIHSGEPLYEGPVWDPIHDALLFTSCRAEEILRWSPGGSAEVWLADNGGVNGMVMGADGRLIAAQVMRHGVLAIDLMTREVEVLASNETWNQPNDVAQSPRGDIYFSDPSWADHSLSAVYRLSPEGEVTRVITDMSVPNGVIVSGDGQWLIVGDSVDKIWRRYPIAEDGSIGEGELFFDPPTEDRLDPDGMARDAEGNLYLTGRGGVWVVTPEGESLGLIPTPVFCSNVGFGGPDGRTLYLTGRGKVYQLQMTVGGG